MFQISYFYLLLIIIIIVLFLFIYHNRNKIKETFITNNQPNSIELLNYQIINDIEEALEIITNQEYLSSFSPVDYYARDIIPANQATYKQIIKHKIKEITSREDKAFGWMINSLKELYPAIVKSSKTTIWNHFLFNFQVIKGDQIDDRMPHTHRQAIIFDQNYFDELVKHHQKNEVSNMLQDQSETLIHEMGHLLERNNPIINNFFQEIYLQLGFVPILPEKFIDIVPDKYRFRIRSNPDELPNLQFYWWKKNSNDNLFYLPLALYTSDKPRFLTDTELSLLVFQEDNGKFLYQKKIGINGSEYQKFLGITSNNYHPKEILPEYLARWYLAIIEGASFGLDMEAIGFKIFEKATMQTFKL